MKTTFLRLTLKATLFPNEPPRKSILDSHNYYGGYSNFGGNYQRKRILTVPSPLRRGNGIMKYQRYKYNEDDISILIELAISRLQSCSQIFENGKWPFSKNVLNGYLVGRKVAKTERLKKAIETYKASYSRYSNYKKISDDKIIEAISLREKGLSLSEIGKKIEIKASAVGAIVSGKYKHPLAPDKKIPGQKGPGAPRKPKQLKPAKQPKQPKPAKLPKQPKRQTNRDLVNALVNALGSPHFDPNPVIEALAKAADQMRERGENPGSLIAVANLLPEITEEAKKRY